MKSPTTLRKLLASGYRKLAAGAVVAGITVTTLSLLSAHGTFGNIFQPFRNDDGKHQTLPNFTGINAGNTFFKTSFGTNGQSCASCHLPSDGFTIHVQTIQELFEKSHGTNPLFALNDAANKPDPQQNLTGLGNKKRAFSLALQLGVFRISEVVPSVTNDKPPQPAEFVVAPQTTVKFGELPNFNDPQHPNAPAISLFRRPLASTNTRFDSAVLWDGRANITNMRGQVTGAAKTLLLNPAPAPADADDVARFMLGISTDQVIDDRDSAPPSHAGSLSADGATSGVFNLRKLAFSPKAPCLYDPAGNLTTSQTPAVTYYPNISPTTLTPPTCTPVVQGGQNMTDFKAWLHEDGSQDPELSRRRIAHGEELFNKANLHIPPDMVVPGEAAGATIHCTTCHATTNIGNHFDARFFVRLGSDSVRILHQLAEAHPEEPSLQDFVKRTRVLPQYCLRSTAAGAPTLDQVSCGKFHGKGSIPGDTITSDPGRAMQTGKWADIGKFKPPILRALAVRSPYFHGSAADSTVSIIDFYNARFNIGLTQQEKDDLVRFVEAR